MVTLWIGHIYLPLTSSLLPKIIEYWPFRFYPLCFKLWLVQVCCLFLMWPPSPCLAYSKLLSTIQLSVCFIMVKYAAWFLFNLMFYSLEDSEYPRFNAWKHFSMKTLFRTPENALNSCWLTGKLDTCHHGYSVATPLTIPRDAVKLLRNCMGLKVGWHSNYSIFAFLFTFIQGRLSKV